MQKAARLLADWGQKAKWFMVRKGCGLHGLFTPPAHLGRNTQHAIFSSRVHTSIDLTATCGPDRDLARRTSCARSSFYIRRDVIFCYELALMHRTVKLTLTHATVPFLMRRIECFCVSLLQKVWIALQIRFYWFVDLGIGLLCGMKE